MEKSMDGSRTSDNTVSNWKPLVDHSTNEAHVFYYNNVCLGL